MFALMYFAQGIAEPTEGLLSQPVRSLLGKWGQSTGEIALFTAMLGTLPWSCKPLYGLITDFVPLWGSRRKHYLLLWSALTTAALGYLFFLPPESGQSTRMLVILLIPTVGIAFMDVVIDALMVQYGQPIGMTGRFQSIQWSASYAATVLTGSTSGWLCKHGYEAWGFGICALASLLMFVTALSFVHERGLPERFALPVPESPRKSLKRVVSSKPLWLTVGFLMCWNFNPFSSVIQQVYMLKHLGLDEQFYGHTLSVGAMGSVIGSVAYGFYCRHVNLRKLMHGSIGLGILTTCLYWGLSGRYSALVISFVVGFAYLTGSLIQLDVAARLCPAEVAGTSFALLMSLTNLSINLGILFGGWSFDIFERWWGLMHPFSFWSVSVASPLRFAGSLYRFSCAPWRHRKGYNR